MKEIEEINSSSCFCFSSNSTTAIEFQFPQIKLSIIPERIVSEERTLDDVFKEHEEDDDINKKVDNGISKGADVDSTSKEAEETQVNNEEALSFS